MSTTKVITCIANNGTNGQPEVPFYECPCGTCTRMEWEVRNEVAEEQILLRDHRHEEFPEFWDEQGKPVAR